MYRKVSKVFRGNDRVRKIMIILLKSFSFKNIKAKDSIFKVLKEEKNPIKPYFFIQ
jgi:hypothetical protein